MDFSLHISSDEETLPNIENNGEIGKKFHDLTNQLLGEYR